jgi:murein DD-endopeptidase MepM/ murein hydrolase activator NlpD
MRRSLIFALSSCLLAGLAAASGACREAAPAPRRTADIVLPDDGRRVEGTVGRGDTFAHLLDRHQVADDDRQSFLDVVEAAFGSRQLRAHHAYSLTLGPDFRVRELTYRIDPDRFLQVLPAFAPAKTGASAGKPAPGGAASARFTTEVVTYRREVGLVAIRGDVDRDHPSLVAALERAGEDVGLAVGIAELFGGDVDFYRDLQPGDVIEVVFEQVLRDGTRVGYGDIVAARLTNDGRLLSAFRFQPAGGKPAYYDAAGLSLKRFFLASPLKFEPRITSGFSYRRLHPVLGIRRPHLGADFGAPKGAPVVAIADAAVVSARYSAGGGNTVTLRHAGGYESRYLHLSAFGAGVRAGARVSQGQVIGRVGATGLVTGAHLHYELLRNGRHVNPVAEQKRNPPGAPIAAGDQAAFASRRAELDQRFVSAVAPPQASSTN